MRKLPNNTLEPTVIHRGRAVLAMDCVLGGGRPLNMAEAQILALRVLAERLENNETGPQAITFSIAA
jgi:hypothetical protein